MVSEKENASYTNTMVSLEEQQQQLEAIFASMTDAVLVYDCAGNILFASSAAHEIFPLQAQQKWGAQPGQKQPFRYTFWDEQGRPLADERAPIQRILRGEVLKGASAIDVVFYAADGQPRYLGISGSPTRNTAGQIMGGVLIAHDVTERQKLLSERAKAQGKEVALQESNWRIEEFLGVASHELRTPLTTIKANIQLAMRRLKSLSSGANVTTEEINEKVNTMQDMLTRAERQVGVLNRLVSDMIDISRIQANKLQVHLPQEPANLVEIVQEVVQKQRKAAPERSILIEMPAVEMIPILADAGRIEQALTNYISNALKYSEATKPIAVRLALEGQTAHISVHDEGRGLSNEEQQHIWECFYQVPDIKVLSGSGVGLGLGLYICQTIIARHQGQVGVQSALGRGSTFWFTLPITHLAVTTENEA